jgi:hypothetical protein
MSSEQSQELNHVSNMTGKHNRNPIRTLALGDRVHNTHFKDGETAAANFFSFIPLLTNFVTLV